MKRLPLILLVAALLLAACERVPDMVLKREPLAKLLVDLKLAEAFCTQYPYGGSNIDSMRRTLRQSTLAKHNVNEAVLDSSMRWYGAHPALFMKVVDRADSILADTLHRLEKSEKLALRVAAGDSVNVWPGAPSVLFAGSEPSAFVTFEVPVDSTWERGDVLTLTFAFDNALTEMSTTVAVDYANRNRTTEAVSTRQFPGDQRRFELKLQTDSTMTATRVYGYFHLEPKAGERAYIDSIRLTRTRMISKDYNNLRRSATRFNRNKL